MQITPVIFSQYRFHLTTTCVYQVEIEVDFILGEDNKTAKPLMNRSYTVIMSRLEEGSLNGKIFEYKTTNLKEASSQYQELVTLLKMWKESLNNPQ